MISRIIDIEANSHRKKEIPFIMENFLIDEFAKDFGDIVYFKMINNEFMDLLTDDDIALFFLKIEEFTEEYALGFDTDAYFNVNP